MKKFFSGKTRIFLVVGCLLVAAAIVLQLSGMGVGLGRAYEGETVLRFAVNADYDLDLVNEKVLDLDGSAVVLASEPSTVSVAQETTEEESEEAHDHDHSFVVTRKTDFEVRIDAVTDREGVTDAIVSALGQSPISSGSILADCDEPSLVGGWYVCVPAADAAAAETTVLAALEEAGYIASVLRVTGYATSDATEDGVEPVQDAVRVEVKVADEATELADSILAALAGDIPTLKLVGIYTAEGYADPADLVIDCLKTLACAAAMLLIYCWIRHDLPAAAAAVLSLIASAAIAASLIVVIGCCYKATPDTAAGILAAEGVSMILSLALLARLDSMAHVTEYQRMAREEVLPAAEKAISGILLAVALVAVLAMASLMLCGVTAVSGMMVSVVIGVLASAVTYWAFTGKVWVALKNAHQSRKANKTAKNA